MTGSGDTTVGPRRRRLGLWIGFGVGALVLVVAAGVVAVVGLGYLSGLKRYHITATNMEPTLKPGDTVTATKANGDYEPKRGDIVVFAAPSAWGRQGTQFLSRVIATPNQTVSCAGGDHPPVVDGKPLSEPYAPGGSCGEAPYTVKVPPHRLWLMGDNRANSYDSHTVYLQFRDASRATVPASTVVAVVRT